MSECFRMFSLLGFFFSDIYMRDSRITINNLDLSTILLGFLKMFLSIYECTEQHHN